MDKNICMHVWEITLERKYLPKNQNTVIASFIVVILDSSQLHQDY